MQMLLGGKHTDASNGAVIPVFNPYTGKQIDTVPCATHEDVQNAIACARRGFAVWSKTPLNKRIAILEKFMDLLTAKKPELLKLMIAESGKCISNADGEIDEAIMLFQAYSEKARNFGGEILPRNSEDRSQNDLLMVVHEPLGVVACITPFNFPVELFAHKVAPAIVMGNAVILKPASDTPLTSIFMAELMLEAGVEPNAIQVITGRGAEVGNWLSLSEDVNMVSLTGSTESGSAVMQNCGKNITRVGLELGGNDPLIVMDNCDLDAAVESAKGGRCWNAGQTCNACKRFLVHNSVKEEFTKKLVESLRGIKIGAPEDRDTVYGTLINEAAANKAVEQVKQCVAEGAELLLGGGLDAPTVMQPTVLGGVTKDMQIACDMEVFGPVWPIIGFDTWQEAVEISNQSSFGLSSGVFCDDLRTAMKIASGLDCGACVIGGNGCYRTAHEPYGGHKKSGIGVEGVAKTLEELTQIKTIILSQVFAD